MTISRPIQTGFALLFVMCLSCELEPSMPVKSVYITGEINSEAFYWKDGVVVKLPTGWKNPSTATSIAISGSDVYIGGSVNDDAFQPLYWKNSKIIRLPKTSLTDNQLPTRALLVMSGDDVYVTSSDCPYYDACKNTLWKNDQPQAIGGQVSGAVYGMAVTRSGEIIVSGRGFPATLWKNGQWELLAGGDFGAESASVFVAGDDVYVAGTVHPDNRFVPCYWKNGARVDIATNNVDAEAYGIFASGDDVYLSGNQKTADGNNRATVWTNGAAVMLESDAHFSNALCIWVDGTDVHVAGVEIDESGRTIAKYWKNGVGTTISQVGTSGYVTAILVK